MQTVRKGSMMLAQERHVQENANRYRKHGLLAVLWAGMALAGQLKVCAESWPPFLYRDADGDVAGMGAEWISRAAGQLGMQPQYQFLSLHACRKLAALGTVDALAFTPNREQLEGWLFTREPMVFWVLSAFVPYHSPHQSFRDLRQFDGQRVGWGQFYRYPDRLVLKRGWQRLTAFDAEAVFTLLVRGKVDVVFDDERFVHQTLPLQSRRQMRALHPAAAAMPQPVAVRPGLPALVQALDNEAQAWRQKGLLDQFYRAQYDTPLERILAISD